MKVEAVILAGGKSSRMRTDKGLLELGGKCMIEYQLDTLSELKIPISISTSNKAYIQFGVPVITDQYQDIGPLGGIHAVLKRGKVEHLIVLSVDAPMVSNSIVKKLVEECESEHIVYSKCGDKEFPLIGVYHQEILSDLEAFIETGGRSVFGFLKEQKPKIVEFPIEMRNLFLNINTPIDLKQLDL